MPDLIKEFKFDLEIKNKTFDSLNAKLYSLMSLADGNVKEIQPLLRYVNDKVATYRNQRQHDSVTVVGSVGNGLYVPEKNEDGSFLLELDVLYNREIPHVVLPSTNSPIVTVQIDPEPIRTMPIGSCLLEVTHNVDKVNENERYKFFNQLENDKTYLKTLGFTCFIPERDGPSILGETEIDDVRKVKMLPLYRTFRTDEQKKILDDKELTFRVLVDKVFALKAPWPHSISNFRNRERKWPDRSVVEEIVKGGCLLTHRASLMAFTLQWKRTFSLSEQELAKKFTFHQRYLFVIIKLIKTKYLSYGLFESGESRIGLTSYHIKTIFLWLCETRDPEQFSKNPGMCFTVFFEVLKLCIEKQICPHFFIPEINVMSGLGYYKKELTHNDKIWLSKKRHLKALLLEKIRKIIEIPLFFLEDKLLKVIDEKHLYDLQKHK